MLGLNKLKEKISLNASVFGLFCSIPNPAAVEIIGEAGFDFVIIDTEHVLVNPETLENMIRAAEGVGITPLVRVADDSHKQIVRLLDAGAQGIVLPMVENSERVAKAVQACQYHPNGRRSVNAGRPGSFGREKAFGERGLVDYMAFSNEQIMVVPMIESQQGFENIQEIVSVNGVSFILEGAADLSQSLGVPWQTEHEKVQNILTQILNTCKKVGIPYCAISRGTDDVKQWRDKGVQIFVMGDERGIAFRALLSHLTKAKIDANTSAL